MTAYKFTVCGYEVSMCSKTSLPPCPKLNGGLALYATHTKKCWTVFSGQGDNPSNLYSYN